MQSVDMVGILTLTTATLNSTLVEQVSDASWCVCVLFGLLVKVHTDYSIFVPVRGSDRFRAFYTLH